MTMDTHTIHNGVDIDCVNETANAIQLDPELARCNFQITNRWISGGHNRTSVRAFYGAKQEIPHRHAFVMDEDEPELLAGHDNGPNPVEYLLSSLAGCMTSSMVYHAALRNIHIDQLDCEVDGDIDLQGFLGLEPDVPKGYQNIRVRFYVKTDEANIKRLQSLTEFSPVLDTLRNGTDINIDIKRK
jgi:uncharacterized OsmC-like protein